jgi:dTDP-4-amino-4,6-dideoxygalactose transaminase
MRIPLVDLKKQYQGLKDEMLAEIGDALEGMQLFLGKNVQTFESDFATYCGTESAIGVGSGTDALHLALLACGIGPGDEVITVSNTFFATVEAIALVGARPVFVDIDSDTYNIDTSQIEGVITSRTRAIIPVHLYGHAADMDPILELARTQRLRSSRMPARPTVPSTKDAALALLVMWAASASTLPRTWVPMVRLVLSRHPTRTLQNNADYCGTTARTPSTIILCLESMTALMRYRLPF